jgi:hypothetical protein
MGFVAWRLAVRVAVKVYAAREKVPPGLKRLLKKSGLFRKAYLRG